MATISRTNLVSASVSGSPPRCLEKLRAVVLLAGSMRNTPLNTLSGRNLVDLPVSPDETLLDQWRLELGELAHDLGRDLLPARVMIERKATAPRPTKGDATVAVSIEEDPGAFRGTGGLLADLARDYAEDEVLLVAAGAQLLMRDMAPEVRRLASAEADVALLATASGEPAGLMLARCGALRGIKPKGFIDLKEQALPQIAMEHDVRIVRTDAPVGRPIRTLESYLGGLRDYVRQARGMPTQDPWLLEDWRSTFALVETGANVDDTAIVHDSVVLAGATVGPGAVIVRSLIGEGAVIQAGPPTLERVVGGPGVSGSAMPTRSGRRPRRGDRGSS